MKLTKNQKQLLLNGLSASKKLAIKKICEKCKDHSGAGIKDVLKKVAKFLGPIAKQVGPVLLKEYVLPLILKTVNTKLGTDIKMPGSGTSPAGSGTIPAGGALKLAGQGKKTSKWIAHVKMTAKSEGITYSQAMKVASKTYKAMHG